MRVQGLRQDSLKRRNLGHIREALTEKASLESIKYTGGSFQKNQLALPGNSAAQEFSEQTSELQRTIKLSKH